MRQRSIWRLIGIALLGIVVVSASASGDTVYLKSGKMLEGKATVVGNKVVVEMRRGMKVTVPKNEVERIEKGDVKPAAAPSPAPPAKSQEGALNEKLAQALAAREIAEKCLPSVVLLLMEDAQGQPLRFGSGFFVRKDVVATNFHVLKGAATGYAKLAARHGVSDLLEKLRESDKYKVVGHLGTDEHTDLALLKIPGTDAPSLPIGDSSKVAVGDAVYVIGSPQGLEGTFSQGIVSSVRKVGTDTLLQITAPISPGSSGGPLLNGQGEVVGIATALFQGGQNLNFAIPSSYLQNLLSQAKFISPLRKAQAVKKREKRKSILGNFGGPSREAVTADNFLWRYSSKYWLGDYSFSLTNKLRESVREVYCLVSFYTDTNEPVDVDVVRYRASIPAGLAKRVTSRVEPSVQKLAGKAANVKLTVLDFLLAKEPPEPWPLRLSLPELADIWQEMTEAQRQALVGTKVQWTAWLFDVTKQKHGSYLALFHIGMRRGPPPAVSPGGDAYWRGFNYGQRLKQWMRTPEWELKAVVAFEVPPDLALKLKKGQRVDFCGLISTAHDIEGVILINLEDANILP